MVAHLNYTDIGKLSRYCSQVMVRGASVEVHLTVP